MDGEINYKHYLSRIAAQNAELKPSIETLFYLQRQHLLHVPFENIDIYYSIPLSLELPLVYDKLVTRKRGGYCYECNSLFYSLLSWLGFNVRMISCRVTNGRQIGREFDHMALIVTIDGQDWLTDVGFGHFSVRPLLMEIGTVQFDGKDRYRIQHFGNVDNINYLSASRESSSKKEFKPVYIFTDRAHSVADFEGMHEYHQTSADSHFTRNLICSQLTVDGRLSLLNNRLITTIGANREESLLYSDHAYADVLEAEFGIVNAVPELKRVN